MAKRQRHDENNTFFLTNNNTNGPNPNTGAPPIPYFPYIQSNNHPLVSNMASCTYSGQVYPTSNGEMSGPMQKRMRVLADDEGQKENNPGGTPKFIILANEIANAVVRRDSIDGTLSNLDKLKVFISSEKEELEFLTKGRSAASSSGVELSEAGTLHWMNNFLLLQIGYLSSFQKDMKVPGSQVSEGPWSKYATSLMKETVEILAQLQEYNYQRHCTGRKSSPANYPDVFGFGGNTQVTVPSFQLSEVEIIESANVLSKVLRRTLDMIQHTLIKGKDLSQCISTLKNCIEVFCYFHRCMYMCLPALKSDQNTICNLVRVVAEVSGNMRMAKEAGDVLDQISALFRSLSTRSGFDLEQPPSVLASICSDIIRYCSQSAGSQDPGPPSFNVDENYAFLMDFLEKLRFALRSRDDSVQQKWHLLFRSMEMMMRTASGNTKLIKSILTCLKYFSMSRNIVPFLSNDLPLVSSIAFTVTNLDKSQTQQEKGKKSENLDLDAMNCVTALATKLVSLPSSAFTNHGCSNVIEVLFSIAGPKPGIRIQSETVKGLRLFIKNHTREIYNALSKMPDPQIKSFLEWMILVPANKKASRSVKQAAVTFVLEILFSEHVEYGSKIYALVLEASQELMICEDNSCEVQIVKTLASKLGQRERLEDLANDTCFLSTMLGAATNDKQVPNIRANAMGIIKKMSSNQEIANKLVGMDDFANCVLKFLSFDGNGECSLYRKYVVQIVAQVSEFPHGKKELSKNKELTRAFLLFARKMPEDREGPETDGDDQKGTGKQHVFSKSRILTAAEDLALMN